MTIEWWFKKGARFRWAAPGDVNVPADGAIVASPAIVSNMTFDGVESRLVPDIAVMDWTAFTYKTAVTHTWLCYAPGRTAETPLATDILTGFMSGCLIVQYVENGQRKVAHVGTTSNAKANVPPNTTVKTAFRTKLGLLSLAEQQQVSGYNPAAAWDYGEVLPMINKFKSGDSKVVSLTTSGGQFFSIVLLREHKWPQIWTSGGCKQIGGMPYNTLVAALS